MQNQLGHHMFNSMSISKKILLIPTVGILSFATFLSLSTFTASKNIEYLNDVKDVQFPVVLAIKEVSNKIEHIETALNQSVITADMELVEKAEITSKEALELLTNLKNLSPDDEIKLIEIEKNLVLYIKEGKALSSEIINNTLNLNNSTSIGQNLNMTLVNLKNDVSIILTDHVETLHYSIRAASESGEELVSIGYGMGLVTITILLVISFPISKGVQGSLLEVVHSLKRMAEGEADLTVRLVTKSKDEIGELVNYFNAFVVKLQTTIQQLVEVSSPLSEMAEKVSISANESKIVTEQQQTGIEQTRIAVSEMYSSVANIAENASSTACSVESASNLSKSGAAVVVESIESIAKLASNVKSASDVVNKLEKDAEQVGSVLSVIKSIAEQTNLLALNAAIEAARAGEQGRGFAVVADEVRTLASKTQSSTTEIQATIEALQTAAKKAVATMDVGKHMADTSVEKAAKAGESLKEIESIVEHINLMVVTIATATEEQSAVSANIASSVDRMSENTDKTRRSATELADISSDLNKLGSTLKRLTSSFKV